MYLLEDGDIWVLELLNFSWDQYYLPSLKPERFPRKHGEVFFFVPEVFYFTFGLIFIKISDEIPKLK